MSDLTLEKFDNEVYLDFNDPTIDRAQKKVIEDTRTHFGEEYDMYINGEWVKGDSGTFNSINPSNTNEVIGTFQLASTDQAVGALDAAWEAFETWQYTPAKKRAEYLLKAADVVKRRRLEMIV